MLFRRLTFQLAPMLDLLLIVIFAQYMEMQETAHRQEVEFDQRLWKSEINENFLSAAHAVDSAKWKQTKKQAKQLKKQMAEMQVEMAETQGELAETQGELTKQKVELATELNRAIKQRNIVAQVVADLFRVPDQLLRYSLNPRSPTEPLPSKGEITEIRKKFRHLSKGRGWEIVRHLLTYHELRKRCDIWEVYVAENGAMTFQAGKTTHRFRAETAESFETILFKRYKSLPQPKGLVILLLSYGDTKALYYETAVDGLPRATERMQADSNGRSRFEYAIIGFNSKGPPSMKPNNRN